MTNIKKTNPFRDYGYDFIRFIAIMMIIIRHFYGILVSQKIPYPSAMKDIVDRGSIQFGMVGVALFFMLSGSLLIYRYKDEFSVKNFFVKRFLRIEIPQLLGFFCALCITYCINPHIFKFNRLGMFISSLGLGYCNIPWSYYDIPILWVLGEWFTAVIIVLYILFPLLRWLFLHAQLISSIIIIGLGLLNIKYHVFTCFGGNISATNGIMFFWIGMLFECYKHFFTRKWIMPISFTLTALYICINPLTILGYSYLSCFIFSLIFYIALYQIKYSSAFTQYVSKYSYEIYLVHRRIYILFIPALLNKNSNTNQIIIAGITLIIISFLTGELLSKASNQIINRFEQIIKKIKEARS